MAGKDVASMRMIWTGILLAGFCLVASASPTPGGAGPTTERLKSALAAQEIPGASVAVVRDGHLVYSATFGVADRTHQTRVTAATRFAIGSMGKQFTATAVMILVDEGKLGLADPLRKHLPDVPEKYDSVTVHHLLSHLSGIPRDFKRGHSLTGRKLYKAMAKSKPDFPAGTSFSYSNTGFILLGKIVERASGSSLETFLQERILGPLKMSRTVCITPDKPIDDRATGYDSIDGDGLTFLPVRFGAGYLLSTAEDLARWDMGLSDGSVLPLESQERMWKPELPSADYKDEQGIDTQVGYGWFLKSVGDKRVVEHSGSLDGFFGTIVRHIDDGVTFVVLTNYERCDLKPLLDLLEADFLPRAMSD